MPFRKRIKRRGRKKRFRKRIGTGQAGYGLTRAPRTILPNKFKTTLTYVSKVNLDPAATTLAQHRFRANCVYDPDFEVGGFQARGFDQLIPMFKKFTVIGSKITAHITPNNQDGGSWIMGISLRGMDETNKTNYVDYVEPGNCIYKIHDPGLDNPPKLTYTYSAKKFHGVSNIMDNGAYGGTAAASPTKGANYHVWLGSVDQLTNIVNTVGMVHLEYVVVFHDPIEVAGS